MKSLQYIIDREVGILAGMNASVPSQSWREKRGFHYLAASECHNVNTHYIAEASRHENESK
jgi:hypothetical protein